MQFENSDELNRWVASQYNGQVILSFSGGKDSLCAWLVMRKYFPDITPFYMYVIPDLEFIEAGLAYYEDFFQTHIIRLPHPSLYRMLNNLLFQAPQNCQVIEDARLPNFSYDDIALIVQQDRGLPEGIYTGTGVRAVDSLNRWSSIKKYGPVNQKRRTYFPIYDYRKDQLIETLRQAQVKLPPEYKYFGRSFDGLDYRFLMPIREHYPRDYDRILAFFPLAELELKRMEYRKRYYEVHNG